MGRANSLNWHIDNEGFIINAVTIGEFSEGETGRIEVADGQKKYMVDDQIFAVGEVQIEIYMKAEDRAEYNNCQDWVKSGRARDVFVSSVDSKLDTQFNYLFKNTVLTFGKKSAFDRNSKAADMKIYFMLPEDIVEIP